MTNLKFFEQGRHLEMKRFQEKLRMALDLIKKNQTLKAKKALAALVAKKLKIRSYRQMQKKHRELLEAKKLRPSKVPQLHAAEHHHAGHLFDEVIYINANRTPTEIAATILHHVGDYLIRNEKIAYKDKLRLSLFKSVKPEPAPQPGSLALRSPY